MAIPKVVSSAEINVGGLIMHVHQLDNGQRVIDADDVAAFFRYPDLEVTPDDMAELAKAIRG